MWAHARGFRSTSDAGFQTALLRDRQAWILRELCSRSDLVVAEYSESKSGLFRLPAQVGTAMWLKARSDGCMVLLLRRFWAVACHVASRRMQVR